MSQPGHSYISHISELSLADRPLAGGKSASLGELTSAGVAVPPGFVVMTPAFDEFLRASAAGDAIRQEIESLDHKDASQVAETSERIRQRVHEMPVPAEVVDAICASYRELSSNGAGCPVAVRSSATCEDSEAASFAGLQDTYLWVRDEEQLIDRVRACWASIYNGESITYRRRLELPEEQIAMAVVVQQMVDAVCAGVMFTRSPTTGDKSVIVIEGSWGLGSSLVSGEVTPDHFVVNKVTGEIVKRDISDKAVEHVADPCGSGVREQAVAEERRHVPCLTDESIAELWQIARTVERHYGSPQDIEWAIYRDPESAEEIVSLLQSRPETVWAARDVEPAAKPAAKAFDHVLDLLSARKKQS
jgi:pyruvate,water dikinase